MLVGPSGGQAMVGAGLREPKAHPAGRLRKAPPSVSSTAVTRPRTARRPLASALLALLLFGACASLTFDRTTEGAGTFKSSAVSFTLLGMHFPSGAMMSARANASDSTLPNLEVNREVLRPYFGRLDFLLNILSVRYARVEGTWGFPPTD